MLAFQIREVKKGCLCGRAGGRGQGERKNVCSGGASRKGPFSGGLIIIKARMLVEIGCGNGELWRSKGLVQDGGLSAFCYNGMTGSGRRDG